MQSIVLAPKDKKIRKQMVKMILKKGFVYSYDVAMYKTGVKSFYNMDTGYNNITYDSAHNIFFFGSYCNRQDVIDGSYKDVGINTFLYSNISEDNNG